MKTGRLLAVSSVVTFIIAVVMLGYMVHASKALSYLSKDPLACVNCHVMNTQYATWQHSSHRSVASCVECHLPTDSFAGKYMAKARDGWNHSVAFTLNTYKNNIQISEDGANRVQANCVSCHAKLAETIVSNNDRFHDFNATPLTVRKCWECHREVPHGKVRSLSTTPNNLGVREL